MKPKATFFGHIAKDNFYQNCGPEKDASSTAAMVYQLFRFPGD